MLFRWSVIDGLFSSPSTPAGLLSRDYSLIRKSPLMSNHLCVIDRLLMKWRAGNNWSGLVWKKSVAGPNLSSGLWI
jgi:hypothetical protein